MAKRAGSHEVYHGSKYWPQWLERHAGHVCAHTHAPNPDRMKKERSDYSMSMLKWGCFLLPPMRGAYAPWQLKKMFIGGGVQTGFLPTRAGGISKLMHQGEFSERLHLSSKG